jgi:hypothetical protein
MPENTNSGGIYAVSSVAKPQAGITMRLIGAYVKPEKGLKAPFYGVSALNG